MITSQAISRKRANQNFAHGLRCLVHPVSISAIVLALINDQVLRRYWPSPLTGKISDFAWLVFAPFILAIVLAWITPLSDGRHQRKLGVLAHILVGLEFVLAKTIPFFHTLTVRAIELATAWGSTLRIDPTDLVALPALGIAWLIWIKVKFKEPALPPTGWLAISLAMLATIANSAAPNYGIICLVEEEDKVYALASYDRSFVSADGGEHWQESSLSSTELRRQCEWQQQAWQIADPQNPSTQFRLLPGTGIERSTDAGETWQRKIDVASEQARLVYHDRKYSGQGYLMPGPLDAVIHQTTGNIIVAMGQQGILLGRPDDTWSWITVDTYSREQPDKVSNILSLLDGELWLSLAVLLLSASSLFWLILRMKRKKAWFRLILIVAAWGTWLAVITLFPPAISNYGYNFVFIYPPIWALILLVAPISISLAIEVYPLSLRGFAITSIAALSVAILYWIPYVIWVMGGLPRYGMATICSFTLIVATLFAGDRYLRRALQGSQQTHGS